MKFTGIAGITVPRAGRCAIQSVSFSVFRFDRLVDRLWVLGQMAVARPALSRTPDIGFWKLFGSGTGEGFTPRPNTAVWAILCTWPSETIARREVADHPVFARWRARAAEDYSVFLTPASSRGRWDGAEPFHRVTPMMNGPIAALTRATIRPRILMKFWERVPDISSAIGTDRNVIFKIGVGEIPWFHQVTFSIWPDASSMAEFARRDGPHARAIRAVREGNWFKEELYARFHVSSDMGTWNGQSPLSRRLEEMRALEEMSA